MPKSTRQRRLEQLMSAAAKQPKAGADSKPFTKNDAQDMLRTLWPKGKDALPQGRFKDAQRVLENYTLPEVSTDPKAIKRRKIVQAATDLFVKQGIKKTSMSQIARRARVAKGTIYLYFKTKTDLLMQAIGEEKMHYFAQLKPVLTGDLAPGERLRLWLRLILVGLGQMPLLSKVMSGDREILEAVKEMQTSLGIDAFAMQADFVSELIDKGAAPHRWTHEEILDRAKVIMGVIYMSGALRDERLRGGLSYERFAGILADMVSAGLVGLDTGDDDQ